MTREARELRARIRASCCPISGLSQRQLEQHVAGIARMVEQALARDDDALAREARQAQRLDRDRERKARSRAAA